MLIPNFLIIGCAKAGTTSLYYWLKQHPQIYMSPIKETNFFALEGEALNFHVGSIGERYLANCVTNLEAYQQLFEGVSQQIAIGEASPIYIYHPRAADNIHHYLPKAKLIVILRNPVERAYSNFLHHLREGVEPIIDFDKVIELEEARIDKRWWWGFHYVNVGFYYKQLKRYFERFDPSQIKIYLYEELEADSTGLVRNIFQFLEVDESFTPDTSTKYNVTGIPRNKLWHQFLTKPNVLRTFLGQLLPLKTRKRIGISLKNQNLVKPRLSSEVRTRLIEIYREDILKLQDSIGRDLTDWLE